MLRNTNTNSWSYKIESNLCELICIYTNLKKQLQIIIRKIGRLLTAWESFLCLLFSPDVTIKAVYTYHYLWRHLYSRSTRSTLIHPT